jgi:4'-phosphopantetheinyl transferase
MHETAPVWSTPPSRQQLAEGVVDVWRVDLAGVGDSACDLLTPGEEERARRFVRVVHRDRWRRGRGMLRMLLGAYLDVDPRRLRLAEGPRGKPEVEPPTPLRFNVSHSGDLALYAFALGRAVGVDVEVGDRPVEEVALARTALGEAAASYLERLDPSIRQREFLRLWTRHEAGLKCRGLGIASSEPEHDGPPLWIADLELEEHAAAALALEGGAPTTLRLWSADAPAGTGCMNPV